jgi:hypothetical protein
MIGIAVAKVKYDSFDLKDSINNYNNNSCYNKAWEEFLVNSV